MCEYIIWLKCNELKFHSTFFVDFLFNCFFFRAIFAHQNCYKIEKHWDYGGGQRVRYFLAYSSKKQISFSLFKWHQGGDLNSYFVFQLHKFWDGWRKGHEIKSDNCSWLWIQLNCKRIMKPTGCERYTLGFSKGKRWKYNLLSVFQEASIHYFRFDLFFLWYYKYMQTIVATVIHFWWRRWLLLLLLTMVVVVVSQVRSFSWSFSGDMKRKRKKIRRAPSLLEYTTHTYIPMTSQCITVNRALVDEDNSLDSLEHSVCAACVMNSYSQMLIYRIYRSVMTSSWFYLHYTDMLICYAVIPCINVCIWNGVCRCYYSRRRRRRLQQIVDFFLSLGSFFFVACLTLCHCNHSYGFDSSKHIFIESEMVLRCFSVQNNVH